MIDFGFLTPPRLEQYGRSLEEITHVVVSHLHADHTGGLEELAFVSRFVHDQRPTLLLPPTIGEALWEHSLRGGLEWITDQEGQSIHCDLSCYFNPVELDTGWRDLGPLAIKVFPTEHVPNKSSWGIILRDNADGSSMIFGCDTRTRHAELLDDPISEDFSDGPIFHDCRLSPSRARAIHIHLSEIDYPPAVQGRVVLVHYEDNLESYSDAIAAAGLKVIAPGQAIHSQSWRADLMESK
jgi:hypothetical protein